MSLAPMIHAMGRGPGRARSLTHIEARDAMTSILAGRAAPEAVGAFLMLLRYRGETAAEIAGMVEAARATLKGWCELAPAIDWPSYAAGRSRGLPWFLLSAKLVARAGLPVLLHGWNSHQASIADVRSQLPQLGIPIVSDPASAGLALAEGGIAYAPLETLSADLFRLLRLRDTLGLRSCINTVLRMLDPARATTSVQGVFHPSYRLLQQDAAALLDRHDMVVLKGAGGEFERHPGKSVALFGLRAGEPFEISAPPQFEAARKLADHAAKSGDLLALWRGNHDEPFAERIVIHTAALVLWSAGRSADLQDAEALAESLWTNRHIDKSQPLEMCL